MDLLPDVQGGLGRGPAGLERRGNWDAFKKSLHLAQWIDVCASLEVRYGAKERLSSVFHDANVGCLMQRRKHAIFKIRSCGPS
jgi:hypothetical protein